VGLFKDIRKAVANARSGEVDLSSLTPEQRAAYDAQMARVAEAQAEAQRTHEQQMGVIQAHHASQVLQGPAGEYAHPRVQGMDPADVQRAFEQGGTGSVLRQALAFSAKGFKEAAKDTFGRNVPDDIEDPQERLRVSMAEYTARQQARAPYRSPITGPIGVVRIPTRGKTQIEEVAAYLASSGLSGRPDLVFGVSRVPDRISPPLTPQSERGRLVEWEIVHAATAPLPPGPPPTVVTFSSRDHWIARRVGEPTVLDEDLGTLYCAHVGLGPEACLGIARSVRIVSPRTGDEGHNPVITRVEGVHIFHVPGFGGPQAIEQMASHAPIRMQFGPFSGTHVEVLNWTEVARVVHPMANRLPPVPSPFPYLPSTPQELLGMYLEVVGVRPADSLSAQVTIDQPHELSGQMAIAGRSFGYTNTGADVPCADGKSRMRLHGASRVVIAYRDRPEYAEGRERWAAYERDVLQANLRNGTNAREPLPADDDWSDIANPMLRVGAKILGTIDSISSWGEAKMPPLHRYCLPPIP
jgi:hypothetical protein